MNKIILTGRLTRDPEIRYSQQTNTAVARYTLAVDRLVKRDGEPQADFLRCVTFGKTAEFAEQYLQQGIKIAVTGHIQTGSYTNRDVLKYYTRDVQVESQQFFQSKADPGSTRQSIFVNNTYNEDDAQYQYFNQRIQPLGIKSNQKLCIKN